MKTALITGTSKGLGKIIAELLLENGWKVIGVSRGEGSIHNPNYIHKECDVSSCVSVQFLMSGLKTEQLDLLVNNSAVFKYEMFEKTSLNAIESIIDTNLKGPIYVTKYALPLMQRNSRIIFINSVAGLEELDHQSIYCASKHGLTGFAGVLSKELQERKIKVTSIHPGGINTPLWDGSNFHDDKTKLLDPKEIAELIMFICHSQKNVEYKTIKLFPDIEWHQ